MNKDEIYSKLLWLGAACNPIGLGFALNLMTNLKECHVQEPNLIFIYFFFQGIVTSSLMIITYCLYEGGKKPRYEGPMVLVFLLTYFIFLGATYLGTKVFIEYINICIFTA